MSQLILVRHGESRWNLANRFTGWMDVPLSQQGVEEAITCAKQLRKVPIHHAFTSNLERAHETLTLILAHQQLTGIFLHPNERKQEWYSCEHHSDKTDILVHNTSLLNERYYGQLQGLDKDFARKKFGEHPVLSWRRSYTVRPPGGESLVDVYKRVIPFFNKRIVPHLKNGKNVIVSAHGNSLRVLLKYIEKISIADLPNLDLPPATPLIYRYRRGGYKRISGELKYTRPLDWDCEDCDVRL